MSKDEKDAVRLESQFAIATELPSDHPNRDLQQQFFLNMEMAALSVLSDNIGLPGGLISKIGLTPAKLEKLEKLRGKDDFFDFLMQLFINDVLRRIDELLRYHLEQMERLLEEIAQEQALLDALDQDNTAIESVLNLYREEGKLLIDDPVKSAIAAYEQRNGVEIENPDYESLLDIDVDIDNLRTQIRSTLDKKQAGYEYHEQQRATLARRREILISGMGGADIESTLVELEQFEQNRAPSSEFPAVQITVEEGKKFTLNEEATLETIVELDDDLDSEAFSFNFPPLKEDFAQVSVEQTPETALDSKSQTPIAKPNLPRM